MEALFQLVRLLDRSNVEHELEQWLEELRCLLARRVVAIADLVSEVDPDITGAFADALREVLDALPNGEVIDALPGTIDSLLAIAPPDVAKLVEHHVRVPFSLGGHKTCVHTGPAL